MHRANPLSTSFRAFTAGGAKSIVDKIADHPLMQEMSGNMMKGETRKNVESPQNYGFTSVVADALKGKDGLMKMGAEAIMSFMGGNRSFPMCTSMDDRRHRLINLIKDAAKGATAMFGQKEWGQQFLNTDTGMFMTGNLEKVMKFALTENKNGQTQTQSNKGPKLARTFRSESGVEFDIETYLLDAEDEAVLRRCGIDPDQHETLQEKLRAAGINQPHGSLRVGRMVATPRTNAGASGTNSDGSVGTSKATGQKTLHKEQSDTYVNMDKNAIATKRGDGNVNVTGDVVQTFHKDKSHDTRCDKNHVHIGFGGNKLWVDATGVWASKPIEIRSCDDQNGSSSGPPKTAGPAAHSAEAPLSLNDAGKMSLGMQAPLKTAPATGPVAFHPGTTVPMVSGGGELFLDIAAPLFVTSDGKLSSTGGGTGAVNQVTATNGLSAAPTTGNVVIGINANGILNASLGTMPAHTYKGNNTGATATPIDVTAAQLLTDIGAAPASHTHVAANITDFSEAVDDRVSGLLVPGANVTLVYNDVAGTLTINSAFVDAPNDGKMYGRRSAAWAQAEDFANKGVANGYASLDAGAKVPAAQLPSYVDDVQEFANLAAFPATGTADIIYVALDTGKIYRWSGSAYVEISPSPGSTDAVPEGSTNLYFTTGRASAAAPVQSVASKTGAVTLVKGDVGLGNVDNTSDLNKPISTATQTALNGKQPLDGDLTSLAGQTSTDVMVYRSATDTWAPVTIGSGITFAGGTLAASASGGNVSNSGTPTNGQIAQWTDATHIQGVNASSLGLAAASEAFVTIGNPAGLSSERALTAGPGITLTDGGANGAATLAAFLHGKCRLVKSGSNLLLQIYDGNTLIINGKVCTIPDAGVTLAPTGLTVGTQYFIYATESGGVVNALEASTTTWATSFAAGNKGVNTKSGDATRTLVATAVPATGPAWADTPTARLVRSWFNRPPLAMHTNLSSNTSTTAGPWTTVSSDGLFFVTWPDELVTLRANIKQTCSVTAGLYAGLLVDGSFLCGMYCTGAEMQSAPSATVTIGGGYHTANLAQGTTAGTITMQASGYTSYGAFIG